MVGIKGVGMTALAVYLSESGHTVIGSDVVEIFPTDSVLLENRINPMIGFKKENITSGIDLVVTSGAHGGLANVEVEEARQKGIKVLTLAEEVGEVMDIHKTKISVCGTHGKTTTSGMAAFVFQKLGLQSSHLVGVSRFSGMNGGRFGGSDYIIVEADEYVTSPGIDSNPRFMYQSPDIIICTNIDYDHPDVYASIEEVEKAYLQFFQKLDPGKGILIYCDEDERLAQLVKKLNGINKIPYRFEQIDNLKVHGRHNSLNAQAVLSLCDSLNLDKNQAMNILKTFTGSSRRLEKIFETEKAILYDDYAHHPAEIKATIEALRSIYPNRRLVVLFQPHTYSRTKTFLSGFILSLAKADIAYVTDIFGSARESAVQFSSEEIVKKAREQGITNIVYCSLSDCKAKLSDNLQAGDVVVTMGAGSIYQAHSDIIDMIIKL